MSYQISHCCCLAAERRHCGGDFTGWHRRRSWRRRWWRRWWWRWRPHGRRVGWWRRLWYSRRGWLEWRWRWLEWRTHGRKRLQRQPDGRKQLQWRTHGAPALGMAVNSTPATGAVVTGRKWWSSGVGDPRCKIMIVMGKTNPEADKYHQQSQILVPMNTPGASVKRMLPVFGYDDAPHGHGEVLFENVKRAGREHAPRRGPRLRDRARAPRTGTHPSLHAHHRRRRAGAGKDGQAPAGRRPSARRSPNIRYGSSAWRRRAPTSR